MVKTAGVNRREFLLRSFLVAGASTALWEAAANAQTPPAKPAQLVVNASGGAMGQAMLDSYVKVFEQRTGIPVILTSPPNLGKLKAMVDSGNVEWNVTEISAFEALRAAHLGLLEPVDDRIVNRSGYPEEARNRYLLTTSIYSTNLAYRTDVFTNGRYPRGWAEFWDTKRFPGARSMYNSPVDNLEFALLADGVDAGKLYPLDVDRAFRKLDRIKPHVAVWWTTGAQPAQLLISKEVVLSTAWNGRMYVVIKEGAPIGISWDQGCIKQAYFGIPRGARSPYWDQQFLAAMTDPKAQAMFANKFVSPGLNPESLKYVDPAVAPYLPNYPANLKKEFWENADWWERNVTEVERRWDRWMLS